MMGVAYDDLAAVQRHSAADGELHPRPAARRPEPPTDPMVFCRSQSTAGLALLTRRFGIRGYATSVHTACASGGQAIGTALKLIRRGSVDYALAGGFDSMISPVGLVGLLPAVGGIAPTTTRRSARAARSTRRATASCSAKAPASSCSRNGKRRGGAARASTPSLPATATRCRRYRITDSPPDGDGPIQSMRAALADAGATPDDIDYINAHGTSTPMNDRSESAAIHAVFGAATADVAVSSTKSTMGHLIAAAGAVEVAVCALDDPSRRDAGQRESASSAIPTAISISSSASRASSACG